ncbi:MAG: response regulator transcription factor [Elusimicrobia bacterium]|nr:response regulator transcription factor [Elusimicrobiota bacterium]
MSQKAATVLVVDDDPVILNLVQATLKSGGFAVRTAKNADTAFGTLTGDIVDLIILDVNLPGLSGMKLMDVLKQDPKTASIPVLMVTVLGKEEERVAGLNRGADDYLVKPFSVKELMARVEALLRRSRHAGMTSRAFELGGIHVDLDRREVKVKQKAIDLTPVEFDLLVRLMEGRGRVLTYQILSEALSDGIRIMTSRNLQTHVKNIRGKLGSAGDRIETVHTLGFKFVAD